MGTNVVFRMALGATELLEMNNNSGPDLAESGYWLPDLSLTVTFPLWFSSMVIRRSSMTPSR